MNLAADTNHFLYAANLDSPYHEAAQRLGEEEASGQQRFLLCRLVLVKPGWEKCRCPEAAALTEREVKSIPVYSL